MIAHSEPRTNLAEGRMAPPLRPLPQLLDAEAHPAASPAAPPAPTFLRLSAGFVYFYFGFLKLFPDLSPAELLAGETLTRISWHWLDASAALFWLALMEVGIGLCFLFNFQLHRVFYVFLFHQLSTFIPLFILPELTFKIAPFAPTMEGQYIFKNLISLAAGWTVMRPAVIAAAEARRRRRAEAKR